MGEDRGAVRNIAKSRMLEHEEYFLSSWLREDVEGKAEDRENTNKESKAESKIGKREVGG